MLLNLAGKEPIFQQIHDQIIKLIELEVIGVNEKLPSCRKLALELGINPNTVQKAYSLLEEDGYIYTLSKKGAFVSEREADDSSAVMESLARELELCVKGNISREAVIELVDKKYGEGKSDAADK